MTVIHFVQNLVDIGPLVLERSLKLTFKIFRDSLDRHNDPLYQTILSYVTIF